MNEWNEDVNALADGELDEQKKKETLKLVDENPEAKAEYGWAVFFKSFLREKLPNTHNEEVWSQCKARLSELDRKSTVETFVGKYSVAMTAILLLVIVYAGAVNRAFGAPELSEQQLAGLLSSGVSGAEEVAETTDINSVLRESIGTEMPKLESYFRVANVSKGSIEGHPFAQLTLLDAQGPMTLFVIHGVQGIDNLERDRFRKEYSTGKLQGDNCVAWMAPDYTFLLVSDRTRDELFSLADQIQQ